MCVRRWQFKFSVYMFHILLDYCHLRCNKPDDYHLVNPPRKLGTIILVYALRQIYYVFLNCCRSQWLRGLRRGSASTRLLGLWVRIPPGIWMSVCCDCCMLSARDFCAGPTDCGVSKWVWVWSLDNEETLVHLRLLRHEGKNPWFLTTNTMKMAFIFYLKYLEFS